jgi:ubiquinone/menaquinone biosynthesis C-methylase UbiE
MDQDISHDRHEHPLVFFDEFRTLADFGIFLMHKRDYEEAARLVRGRSVLDLGCNNGYGSRILADACRRIVAVDVSEAAIADAIRRFGNVGIEFQTVDGEMLPFEDGAFEAVVSFQVIEHIAEPDNYLSEIVRVLGPEGQAIFTTPNKAIRLDVGMAPWNKHHVQEFTHQELRDLLRSYFTRVRVRGQFASGDLYRIERARCARSRALARGGASARVQQWLRAWAPAPVAAQLRALRDLGRIGRRSGSRTYTHLDNKEYSTTQYSYRDTDLQEALSLFAIGWKAAS